MPADSAVDAPDLLGRRTIEAIAALVESHCGALWLRSADGRAYEPAASWNMRDPGVTVSAESSLATFLRARQWVVSVPDWRDDPGRYEGLHLPPWCLEPGRFELIVPLALHAQLLGFVALGPTRTPIVLVRGKGVRVYDADGREYLDLLAGIGVEPFAGAPLFRSGPTLLQLPPRPRTPVNFLLRPTSASTERCLGLAIPHPFPSVPR